MLKQRVITAIVLLVGLSAALALMDLAAWSWLVAVGLGFAGWEWARLGGAGPMPARIAGVLAFAVVALSAQWAFGPDGVRPGAVGRLTALHGVAVLFWLFTVPAWMSRAARPTVLVHGLTGFIVLLPPALALIQLRAVGVLPLLLLMAVVWIADIAAYFSGRAFGRHKLAPSISPGKTWEGAFGGAVAVQVYGFAIRPLLADSGLVLPSIAVWAGVLLLLTAVSIVGDLFESMLKRQAGMKDSSQLLPGHGGVLDRVDSLTATLPLIGLYLLTLNSGTLH